MRRRSSKLVTVLSLALLVTTIGVWLRSFWRSYSIAYFGSSGHRLVQIHYGGLALADDNVTFPHPRFELDSWSLRPTSDFWRGGPVTASLRTNNVGFHYTCWQEPSSGLSLGAVTSVGTTLQPTVITRVLVIPLWSFMILFSVLPLRTPLHFANAYMASSPGKCPKCGYDLRATPDRCPECGTVRPPSGEKSMPEPTVDEPVHRV